MWKSTADKFEDIKDSYSKFNRGIYLGKVDKKKRKKNFISKLTLKRGTAS